MTQDTQKHLESQFFNHRWVLCEANASPTSNEKGGCWVDLTDVSHLQIDEICILIYLKSGSTYMFHHDGDEMNALEVSQYLLREIEFAHGRMPIPGDM
jgi:hypothetical protein